MRQKFRCVVLVCLFCCLSTEGLFAECGKGGSTGKPRLLVLTDIGQDPDDQQSLVRLLHYANEFDIEGIVASADNNWKHESPVVRVDLIEEALEAYAEVLPSLRLHDPCYPGAEALLAVVKPGNDLGGNAVAAEDTIGAGRDTKGSEWIVDLVDRKDARPLNVAIWGGSADLAQALWKVRETRTEAEVAAFVKRLRIYAITDQDSTNQWILKNFPGIFYVRSHQGEGNSLLSAFRGIYLGGDYETVSREWVSENIKDGHGPLGAYYPSKVHTQSNPHKALKEGDTPSFLYFLENGLQDPEQPGFGGWGGRFERVNGHFEDALDKVGDTTSYRATVWRWRKQFQNDFAARLDWGVMPFEEANHHPRAAINGDLSRGIAYREVTPGELVELSAGGSVDPDGDRLGYHWWIYPEAGSSTILPEIENARGRVARLLVPEGKSCKTLHVILEVSDDGEPSLVGYRRVVLKIR